MRCTVWSTVHIRKSNSLTGTALRCCHGTSPNVAVRPGFTTRQNTIHSSIKLVAQLTLSEQLVLLKYLSYILIGSTICVQRQDLSGTERLH